MNVSELIFISNPPHNMFRHEGRFKGFLEIKMKKILLVEDNEMNREMLLHRLERKGFEVEVAKNGQDALDHLNANNKPDIILMDMSMPVLDGWETTRIIKSNDNLKAIPIIGLSANALESDKARAVEVGCDDYITKPINLDKLINKITGIDNLVG